ncbi:50S ribosomal protein L11 methyltransferase [Streptomyces dangxiongensis]|uniref:50S ribosomal protein L11 methyltransferase n=1 Tax=Streptomyces dangxiongensis TaxID=1442032 RepID=UPI001F094547|nr:50S ribosomal protein L11 methyltransferase [Streptomyces dangxiongensis]
MQHVQGARDTPAEQEVRPEPGAVPSSGSSYRLGAALLQSLAQEMNALAEQASALLSTPPESLSLDADIVAQIARRNVPRWHFAMLNDIERNDGLVAALERGIPAGATVLDIGSGSGLLAMAAARAGASKVITCEMNPLLAEIARNVIDAHGLSDVITVFGKPSTELDAERDLGGRVDVLVSEIVDCGLIGEGLLPSVRHAREHLLAPDGIMLPSAARLRGRLVSSEAVLKLNQVTTAGGFDVSLMNTVATRGHFPVRLDTWPHRFLSEAAPVLEFDLARDALEPGERTLTLPATADGEAQALVVWFELDMGNGVVLSNPPDNPGSHWMQGWVPLEKPVPTKAGETVSLRLRWSDFTLRLSL